jgi:hypothetical protein
MWGNVLNMLHERKQLGYELEVRWVQGGTVCKPWWPARGKVVLARPALYRRLYPLFVRLGPMLQSVAGACN